MIHFSTNSKKFVILGTIIKPLTHYHRETLSRVSWFPRLDALSL